MPEDSYATGYSSPVRLSSLNFLSVVAGGGGATFACRQQSGDRLHWPA